MKATDLVKNNVLQTGDLPYITDVNGKMETVVFTNVALTAVNLAGIEMRDKAINAYIRMSPSATPEQLNQFRRLLNEDDLALKEEQHAVIDTSLSGVSDEYYRFSGSYEECLEYIKEHEKEPNLGIIS